MASNVNITFNDKVYTVLFGINGSIANLKQLFQLQAGVRANELEFFMGSRVLLDTDTLASLGLGANCAISARKVLPGQLPTSSPNPQPQTTSILGPVNQTSTPSSTDVLRRVLGNVSARLSDGSPQQQPQPSPANNPQANPNSNTAVLRNILSNLGSNQQQQPRRRVQIPDPDVFRSEILASPDHLTQLLHNDPLMADAVLAEDRTLLTALLEERALAHMEKEEEERRRIEELNADPYNAENQAIIEKKIQEEILSQNYKDAMEYIPEAFGTVVMLYIPVVVNGIPCQAFVDSGAQMTIMSVDFATKCNIMRLVDPRYAGMAQGVGTAPIVGRVHMAQIKIGTQFYPFSITVIDGKKGVEFLLGLDMLKRHLCLIDLKRNGLEIGGELVPFLGEGEIEEVKKAKAESNAMDEDIKPEEVKSNFPESDVNELLEMGYTKAQVHEALTVCNGDRQAAAWYLLESAKK